MMKRFFAGLMVVWVVMGSVAAQAEGTLTESEVRQFMAQGDKAANAMQFERLVGMLAPDAVIEMTVQGQTRRLSREDYQAMLEQGRPYLKAYSHQSKILSVTVTGDKAVVKSTTRETANYGDKGTYNSVTQEQSELEKRNGKWYVTKVRSQVGMLE